LAAAAEKHLPQRTHQLFRWCDLCLNSYTALALGREDPPLVSAATQLALLHNVLIAPGRKEQPLVREHHAPEPSPGSEFGGQIPSLRPGRVSWSEEPDPPTAALVGSLGGQAGSVGGRHAMGALREWPAGQVVPPASLPPRNDLPRRSSRQPLVLRPDRPSRCAREGRTFARLAPAGFRLHKKRNFRCFPVDKTHTRIPRLLLRLRVLRAALFASYGGHFQSMRRTSGYFQSIFDAPNSLKNRIGFHNRNLP
jgi:hypothetical protein